MDRPTGIGLVGGTEGGRGRGARRHLNGVLGLLREWQSGFEGRRHGTDPAIERVAEGGDLVACDGITKIERNLTLTVGQNQGRVPEHSIDEVSALLGWSTGRTCV